jgi:hypothetical protein
VTPELLLWHMTRLSLLCHDSATARACLLYMPFVAAFMHDALSRHNHNHAATDTGTQVTVS